jgi:hypothetical protein
VATQAAAPGNAAQTYENNVTLSKDTSLVEKNGGNITFKQTVDSDATARDLTVNTAGNETFNGVVGGNSALASLKTDVSGTVGGQAQFNMDASLGPVNPGGVNVNGAVLINDAVAFNEANSSSAAHPSVLTGLAGGSGTQTYNGAATLQKDTVVADMNGKGIAFNGTVDGPANLIINASATLGKAMGNSTALASLTVNGATAINGGAINTAVGGQVYNGAVTLGNDAALKDTAGGNVNFASTVDGKHALEIDSAGDEIFHGVVGGTAPLTTLTTDAVGAKGGQAQFLMTAPGGKNPAGVNAGSLLLNDGVLFKVVHGDTLAKPSVQTTDPLGQIYNGMITLRANTEVVGKNVQVKGGLDASGFKFTIGLSQANEQAEEADRRGLATITPREARREAKNYEMISVLPTNNPTGIYLRSSEVAGTKGGQVQFLMTAQDRNNPAGVSAGSLLLNDGFLFNVGNGGTLAKASVQTTDPHSQISNGQITLDVNTAALAANIQANGGLNGNGFAFTEGLIMVPGLAEEVDRRSLSTVTPWERRGEAKKSEMSSVPPKAAPSIYLRSSEVP